MIHFCGTFDVIELPQIEKYFNGARGSQIFYSDLRMFNVGAVGSAQHVYGQLDTVYLGNALHIIIKQASPTVCLPKDCVK